jgi:hypothetical protein
MKFRIEILLLIFIVLALVYFALFKTTCTSCENYKFEIDLNYCEMLDPEENVDDYIRDECKRFNL